ncbi:MAG TPA: sugar MFS transporter [Terracidiphilus sp.]|jgi:FHS family L-fucose permease-like MFS transporter|nr:sugar MFS transporter [Terracidiphilus sp.]
MATRSTPTAATGNAPSYVGPFITVAILFGIFGFLTSLNNVLVKKLEDIFQLSHGPAMLATAAWFLAYLVFSVPAAKVIEKVGYKRTMVISLLVMACGALLFLPAANMVSFPMTLFAIFILASGVCGLQTSANPYVSILGPEHSAPARLTLAQAFNSIGSFAAPWVAGVFILSGSNLAADAHATAHMLQGPYIAIAAALLLLSFAVMMMHLPAITGTRDFRPGDVASGRSIWSYSHTVLGMVGIFFYVGLEIALAAITIQFCLSQGMTKVETASLMVSLFYFGMMVGRLLGSFIMVWIKAEKLLVLLGGLGVALLLTAMFTHGTVAIACLVLTGIANSVMYPNIFALGIAELGPLTSKGSGVITIGNVGGAILPPLFGFVADRVGIQYAFFIPIVGYLFVVYYGLVGYKPSRVAKA